MTSSTEHIGPVLAVGYDGSKSSRNALAYAGERAGSDGLVVVSHTFGPGPAWFGAPSYHRPDDDYEALGRAVIAELDLPPGVRVEVELNEGAPAERLIAVARKWGADEIVIGSRGFFPIRGGLGRVSVEVLRLADRPVTVIPPAFAAVAESPSAALAAS